MPKKLPSYRCHVASGQGYTVRKGKSYYFGPYGHPDSEPKFWRKMAEWSALNADPTPNTSPGSSPWVSELISAFLKYAARKYVKDGRPTSELAVYRSAVQPALDLYCNVPSAEFGPIALETIRQQWVMQGLSRKTINKYVSRIVRVWKWGVSQQIVPVSAWQALTSLEPLRQGQGRDNPKIIPALDGQINAVQPFVSRQVWAMIQFQLATGCRPHEACQVRFVDIDTTKELWAYRPGSWKTQHHGTDRVVYLGPVAQGIVTEWQRKNPEELLWQPREARQDWLDAHGGTKRPVGKFQSGHQYTATSYGRAIERACEKAFGCPAHLKRLYRPKVGDDIEQIKKDAANWRKAHCWSPNQLRHAAATRIRATYGIEVARIILGHASAVTTEVYAEVDRLKAVQAVRELG